MNLEILTPDQKLFSGEVDSVQLPGSKGSFEILKNHAPLISSLEKGKIRVKQNAQELFFPIKNGFVEVLNNKVIVLVEGVIEPESIE